MLNMQSTKPRSTPLATQFKFSATLSPQFEEEKEHTVHVSYSSCTSSIIYSMVSVYSDILHAVSVTRYMANPRKEYWQGKTWILQRVLQILTLYMTWLLFIITGLLDFQIPIMQAI